MKKNLLLLLCAVFLTGITAFAGKRIDASALPQKARTFLTTYFNGVGIRKIEKERHLYEIELTNGVEYHISGDATTVHRHYDD